MSLPSTTRTDGLISESNHVALSAVWLRAKVMKLGGQQQLDEQRWRCRVLPVGIVHIGLYYGTTQYQQH